MRYPIRGNRDCWGISRMRRMPEMFCDRRWDLSFSCLLKRITPTFRAWSPWRAEKIEISDRGFRGIRRQKVWNAQRRDRPNKWKLVVRQITVDHADEFSILGSFVYRTVIVRFRRNLDQGRLNKYLKTQMIDDILKVYMTTSIGNTI